MGLAGKTAVVYPGGICRVRRVAHRPPPGWRKPSHDYPMLPNEQLRRRFLPVARRSLSQQI